MTTTEQQGSLSYNPTPRLWFDTEPEAVALDQDRLELFLRDYVEARDLPSIDDVLPWAGLTITLVLALVTTDFKNDGLPAGTWAGAALVGAVLSLYMTMKKAYAAAVAEVNRRTGRLQTARQCASILVEEMRNRTKATGQIAVPEAGTLRPPPASQGQTTGNEA